MHSTDGEPGTLGGDCGQGGCVDYCRFGGPGTAGKVYGRTARQGDGLPKTVVKLGC